MKSLLIGCAVASVIGVGAASAQSTKAGDPTPSPMATPSAASTPMATPSAAANSAGDASFIAKQETSLVRAPKLVGVAVYDSNNKAVGKIADILLDHDGAAKAVVIGIGGFLGIGSKDIALPYSAVKWETEQRTVTSNSAAPAAGGGQGGSMSGTSGSAGGSAGSTPAPAATKTIDPAQTEAYQGYPDKAMVNFTQDQLKAAPEFKYADNPASTGGAAGGSAPADTATPTAPKQ